MRPRLQGSWVIRRRAAAMKWHRGLQPSRWLVRALLADNAPLRSYRGVVLPFPLIHRPLLSQQIALGPILRCLLPGAGPRPVCGEQDPAFGRTQPPVQTPSPALRGPGSWCGPAAFPGCAPGWAAARSRGCCPGSLPALPPPAARWLAPSRCARRSPLQRLGTIPCRQLRCQHRDRLAHRFGGGVGLGDPQKSLPTSTVLGSCGCSTG